MATKTKLSLQPVGGNILVEPEEMESSTPSGLVIATSGKGEKPQMGMIVALGTGRLDKDGKKLPWNVDVGQKVVFKKYGPDEVEVGDKNYLIMQEEDILAVLNS